MDSSRFDSFLAPLRKQLARDIALETLVFWGSDNGWPDTPAEALEAEEVAFYAEGLVPEGFHMEWRILAEAGSTRADHLRLYAWEDGSPPPAEAPGWQVLAQARWEG